MYIKSVKVQGFKSFADKIELDFSSGMCAIVGPNGSGKSNVVDAILWVLGEQSVKSLRGESQMSDIIFNGSKTRDGHKKASVSILFDNTDRRLNTDFNEVEIKRTIYKTGENEYFINNTRVRLKDITDILMDVTSKFNIISQGNINALVENKSSERRNLFENAAGVLKYKKRKEDTLKKIEGTNENLTRINFIIKELNTTLKPLEKQKEDATKYLEIKKELEQIEVALIASDISSFTSRYEELKIENKNIQFKLENSQVTHPMTLEKKKLENVKIDEEITNLNKNILELTKIISSLNSQKQINLERVNLQVSHDALNTNLISLKENKMELEKTIAVIENELSNLKNDIQILTSEYNTVSNDELKQKIKVSNLGTDLNKINREILELTNKISIEKNNIENNAFMPKSVKSIIDNPRFTGIHNTISGVIQINEEHLTAINTALGAAANFIITDDMNAAKKAINFLKENHLGRATFFPIDTISSRHISQEIAYTLESLPGFIGVASDLIEYKNEYKNIIENQLGNVLVVDDIDNLFDIAKVTEFKYKLVSLEGEIVYPGGSISGGEIQKGVNSKSELIKLNKELENLKLTFKNMELNLIEEEENYRKLVAESDDKKRKISEKRYAIEVETTRFNEITEKLNEVNDNIQGLEDINDNKIDDSINKIMDEISNSEKQKAIYENKLKELQSKKFDLTNEISELEKEIQMQNSSYRKMESQMNNNEIEIGKYEVKIDNLLNILSNDYSMTYESAQNNYSLDIDTDLARNKVSSFKNALKQLTNINLGSIEEYNRLKKRYDFLSSQKDDLENSINDLMAIINEMDEIMKEKFKTTFDSISKEFSKVFRVMFKGGNGILKLTDENDLLNTGISILAVPPGKKLNSITSLSGGEKALTAICLIFAILNVKPVPFIILDEAEAPLDEENVNMFGEYLNNMKHQSQFILITHKKKMMEFADVLYGVTMQESGVSKLVSVKLEDFN